MKIDSVNRKQELDTIAIALLFISCVSWGLNQVAIKVAIQSVPPLLQCGNRWYLQRTTDFRSLKIFVISFFWNDDTATRYRHDSVDLNLESILDTGM